MEQFTTHASTEVFKHNKQLKANGRKVRKREKVVIYQEMKTNLYVHKMKIFNLLKPQFIQDKQNCCCNVIYISLV